MYNSNTSTVTQLSLCGEVLRSITCFGQVCALTGPLAPEDGCLGPQCEPQGVQSRGECDWLCHYGQVCALRGPLASEDVCLGAQCEPQGIQSRGECDWLWP